MSTFFNKSGGSPPRRLPIKRAFSGLVGRFDAAQEIPPRFIGRSLLQAIPVDVAILLDGRTDPLVKFTMTAAAIRAAKWRAKQDADFNKREAERKAATRANERTESDRIQQIEDLLKKDPTNAHNGPFVMRDAPHGKGMIVTGGYDSEKIETVHAAANSKEAKPVRPSGTSGTTFEKGKPLTGSKLLGVEPDKANQEYDETFVDKAFKYIKTSKHARIMKEFVYQHTRIGTDRAYHCVGCGYAITPFQQDVTELGFLHIAASHGENLFPILLKKLDGSGCPEDHDGMVARHGGDIKVVCKRCKKVVYKPPKNSVRTKS